MLYLVKLGGSLITDKSKPLHARRDVIKQVAEELGELYRQKNARWVLGTGAGSYGHYTVNQVNYKSSPADPLKIARIHRSSERLSGIVVDALHEAAVPAAMYSPFQHVIDAAVELNTRLEQLESMSAAGIIPVVYGDMVLKMDGSSRILPTEEMLHEIGRCSEDDVTTIYVTSVDGVLDSKKRVIPIFTKAMSIHTHKNNDFDVTGGMAQKVREGFEALTYSKHVYVINGLIKGQLTEAVNLLAVGTQLQA